MRRRTRSPTGASTSVAIRQALHVTRQGWRARFGTLTEVSTTSDAAEHAPEHGHEHEHEHDEILLDRIDALRVLRADSEDERGALLEEIGGAGKPEQDIVRELSMVRPLWLPDRFEEAHRLTMRSLEVLDRNGARTAPMPRYIGPLKPIAQWAVQQVNRWIVKNHQNTIIDKVRKLYERREANSVWGSPEHRMLRRARINAVQVEEKLKGKALGLPAFLLGGAFFSAVIGIAQSVVKTAFGSRFGLGVFAAILFVFLLAAAWVVLFAAAVSRRRIRLACDQPLHALWETVGAAGNPPRDQSYSFAVYALVFLASAWVIVPLAIFLIVRHP